MVMKLNRSLCLWSVLILVGLLHGSCSADRGAKSELRRAFIQAHEEADVDALVALYYLEGVRESDRMLLRMAAAEEVRLSLESVVFAPVGDTDPYGDGTDPTSLVGSLPVSGLMVVSYATPERLTAAYPIGFEGGKAWLAAPRPRVDIE